MIVNKYLQVIPENMWDKVNEKYNIQYARSTESEIDGEENEYNEGNFILNGVVFCGKCQKPAYGRVVKKSGEVLEIYRCISHSKNRIDKDLLESEVINSLKMKIMQLVDDGGNKIIFKKVREDYERAINRLQNDMSRIENRLSALSDQWMENKRNNLLKKEMLELLNNIEGKKEELDKIRMALQLLTKEKVSKLINNKELDNEYAKELIRSLVDKIYLGIGYKSVEYKKDILSRSDDDVVV